MWAFLATCKQTLRRRWRLLAALAVLGGVAIVAGPHLWAWYHWQMGQRELERYHGADALDHLNHCLQVWPNSGRVHLLASRAARQAGNYEQADQHLRVCEHLPEASEDAALERILLHACAGDMSQSIESYLLSRAEKDPSLVPLVLEGLAEGYARTYRIGEAFQCLERWLERDPDNLRALFLRGNLYREMSRLQAGLPDYRRVVELDPEQDDARLWLVVGLLEDARYEEAWPHLEVLGRRRPDDIDVQVWTARCRAGLGQLAQARQLLDAVLAAHPDHGLALRTRGGIELAEGLAAQAEPWLRQAAQAMPSDYQAQWWLLQSLREQGKHKEAAARKVAVDGLKDRLARLAEITTTQLSAKPHDPALHCKLGKLYLSLGNETLGERWLQVALRENAGYRDAHVALADFYQARGDLTQAAYHREQAALLGGPSSAGGGP
jgi:tetratricopeptide (TPR) repeat protein